MHCKQQIYNLPYLYQKPVNGVSQYSMYIVFLLDTLVFALKQCNVALKREHLINIVRRQLERTT